MTRSSNFISKDETDDGHVIYTYYKETVDRHGNIKRTPYTRKYKKADKSIYKSDIVNLVRHVKDKESLHKIYEYIENILKNHN